jgi:cysteine-rich repeat protein
MLCPNANQFAQCSPLPVHCPTAANALAECGSTPAPAGWPNLGQPGAALATINLAYIGNNPQAMAFGSLTNFVAPVEECDDGSASNTDSCVRRNIDGDGELECAFNFCGDGFAYDTVSDNTNPNATEQCDELLGSTNRANNGDSCIDTCQWNTCHDGWRYTAVSNAANTNGLEECDDGNTNDNDGCVDECVVATCGDAHVNYTAIGNDPWEECDDGNTTNTDACRNDCTRNPNTNGTCGDGIVQAAMGEECDDGNNAANSSCTPNCRWARCGDGVNYTNETDTTNPFEDPQDEDCDDGNFVAGGDQANDRDQCILGCKDADCGDGNLYTHDLTDTTGQHTALGNPEECDDGNDVATDGCNTTCALPECGDGVLDPGEECDDNNTTDGDGCQANCMLPVCGDGIADPGEGCDGADLGGTCTGGANAGEVCGFNSQCPGGTCTVNLLAGTFCEANCELSSCGNNTTDPGEDCDDGNDSPNDTCNHCRDVFCGDGILQKDGRDGIPNTGDDEQCDDGDADPTDSCLPNCKWNTCGDGVRLETIDANAPSFQTTTEMCDSGTLYSAHVNDDLNNGNPDDDYTDSAGLCNSACQIQCFANQGAGGGATPGNYWGTLWKGGTACVFVAEPYASTGGTAYDPYYGGFDDARDHCMGYGIPGIDLVDLTGGNLTQLNTQVDTLLQNAYTNNPGGFGTARAYLGLFDDAPANLDPPGTWSWLRTDTPLDPLNTNWAIGRPNDTNGTEDCGTIGRADGFLPGGTGTAGQWDDVPCTQTWRSVCEFPWPVGAP